MSTEAMKLQEIMSQAQVFASAWSLVGGRFDGGNAMDEAEVAKNELYQMIAEALAQPQQEPVADEVRCPECGYLTKHTEHIGCLRKKLNAINAFEQRNFAIVNMDKFPQPAQQEPVAWMHTNAIGHVYFRKNPQDKTLNPVPLYTSPPARKPLTDEEIESMWIGSVGFLNPMLNQHTRLAFARAIEAAHGIKENT